MKNVSKMFLSAALVASASLVSLAQAPAAPAAAPAPAPKKVTLEDRLAFLPEVVATIGDQKITKKDVITAFGANNVPEIIQNVPEAELREYAKALINSMVDEAILIKLAEKEGIKPSAELAATSFDADVAKLTPENRAAIEQQLKAQGKDIATMKAEYIKNPDFQKFVAVKAFLDKTMADKISNDVSDEDVTKFYNENKETTFKKSVDASHILIMANGRDKEGKMLSAEDAKKQDEEAKKKIEAIAEQLKKGGNFENIAVQQSECPSGKQNKGSLGSFDRGRMVPEFDKAAFAMTKPGTISDIVKSPFGYHIIRYNGAEYMPLDDSLKDAIRNDAIQRRKAEYLDGILKGAKTSLNVTETEFAPMAK